MDQLASAGRCEDSEDSAAAASSASQSSSESDSGMGRLLTELVPASPDIIRATRAAVPLECFGAILRQGVNSAVARGDSQDRYSRSRCTGHFDEFWSHSWHSPPWQKVLTLFFFYNAPAAVAVSLAATGLGAGLQLLWPGGLAPTLQAAGWLSFCPACLSFALTLAFWRSQRRIFLDSVCICQGDAELKKQGILSLGGFLRHSRSMLILWDPSYCGRLWCVFEQAAFFYLQTNDPSRRIYLRPTFQVAGWLLIMPLLCLSNALFLTLSTRLSVSSAHHVSFAFLVLAVANPMRRMARDLAKIPARIESFSMESAECFCCSHGHLHPVTREELPCDRLMVEASVKEWFGSTEIFVHFVRTEMKQHFAAQCDTPPYRIAVLWGVPRLWRALGACAWHWGRSRRYAVRHAVLNVFGILFWFPLTAEACFRLASRLRKREPDRLLDRAKDVAVAAVVWLLDFLMWGSFDAMTTSEWISWRVYVPATLGCFTITALLYRQRLFH